MKPAICRRCGLPSRSFYGAVALLSRAGRPLIVNFTLRLAQLVEPDRAWRIVTSNDHSTVWDGAQTLFDFNFLALGVNPDECFALADKRRLRPGQELNVYMAQHYSKAA